jgi:hypothetical protein
MRATPALHEMTDVICETSLSARTVDHFKERSAPEDRQ